MSFVDMDDDIDIDYTPSIVSNSRSAGMKKIVRKTDNKPTPIVTKKQNDFDLLDDLLGSPGPVTKKSGVDNGKQSSSNIFKDKNDIDSFFDESPLPTINKNTSKTNVMSNGRPFTAAPANTTSIALDDNMIEEPSQSRTSGFKFKRPESAISVSKPKIYEEEPEIKITPSQSRMMKPPLRKRESLEKSHEEIARPKLELGLTLPETNTRTGLTLDEPDSAFSKNSLNLNKRRSSIEITPNESTIKNKGENNSKLVLPDSNDSKNFSLSFGKEQGKSKKFQLTLEPKKQEIKPYWETQNSVTIQQNNSYKNETKRYEAPLKYEVPQTKTSNQELEKEIQFIKHNYQKHIDCLQKNLQDQIRQNKSSRDRLMKETTSMIQNQRSRMKKIHQEELQRVKQMGEWEKRKIEENYKGQINLLKSEIEKYKEMYEKTDKRKDQFELHSDSKQIQYLQDRLRNERKLIEEKTKILDKREINLEEREKEINKKKRFEQERLRQEQKRIFQTEIDTKKQILNEKRMLEDQKQSIATQLASLEMGNYKKSQNIELLRSEMEMKKRQIEKERVEMRNMNNQIMFEYQKKCQQLRIEKQRVSKMESELMGKIKIVQAHATRQRFNTTNPVTKQNTWVNTGTIQNFRSDSVPKKSMSIDKTNEQKKFQTTQNRFMEMTSNLKENLKLNRKGQDFDIDNYLMSMAHYTRSREPVH